MTSRSLFGTSQRPLVLAASPHRSTPSLTGPSPSSGIRSHPRSASPSRPSSGPDTGLSQEIHDPRRRQRLLSVSRRYIYPDNKGLSEVSAERRHEERSSGSRHRSATLQRSTEGEEKRIKGLQGRLERGAVDVNGRIAGAIRAAESGVENAKGTSRWPDVLHSNVTKYMPIANNRCTSHVLFVDPIGVSSDGDGTGSPERMRSGRISREKSCTLACLPSSISLIDNMLFIYLYFITQATKSTMQCSWSVCAPTSLTARATDTPSMACYRLAAPFLRANSSGSSSSMPTATTLAMVKHGRTTGTIMECVSTLTSLVRHYDYIGIGIDFWSRELIVVPYDETRGAFSATGDSGSIIADRVAASWPCSLAAAVADLPTPPGSPSPPRPVSSRSASRKLSPASASWIRFVHSSSL
jgi:hypothetical protein